jgi:hypothetical protein
LRSSSVTRIRQGAFGVNCEPRNSPSSSHRVFVRKEGADITAPLARFHPEIAEPKDLPPSVSCEALAAASAPQILFTNLAAASAMCGAFYRLLRTDLDEPMHDEACFDILDARMVPHRLSVVAPGSG